MDNVFPPTTEQLDAVRKYVADFDRAPRIRVGMYGEHGVGKMNIIERVCSLQEDVTLSSLMRW